MRCGSPLKTRCLVLGMMWILLKSCVTVCPSIATDEERILEPERETLRIGYSLTTLLAVNPQDAEAATNVLVELIARKNGQNISVETRVFDKLLDITREALADRLHIVSVVSQEYLELSKSVTLDPVFVPLRNGSVYEEILLLVRKDEEDAGLKSLAGKRLLVSVTRTNNLPYLWLDTILLSANLPQAREFLGNIEEVNTPSRAVLPVFFGQADACVTINSAYQTLKALNPQIGEELVALKTSLPLLMSVLCINERLETNFMKIVREELPQLSQYPEGKQLLTLFGIEGHVPFREEYLEGMQHLIQKAERLRTERGLR